MQTHKSVIRKRFIAGLLEGMTVEVELRHVDAAHAASFVADLRAQQTRRGFVQSHGRARFLIESARVERIGA